MKNSSQRLVMSDTNQKKSSRLGISLRVLLAVGFVLSASLSTLLFNIGVVLFDPATYQQALLSENIYNQIPGLISEQIILNRGTNPCLEDPGLCEGEERFVNNPPVYLQNLSRADWESILGVLLPQDWLQEQTESVIEQVFANLKLNQPVQATITLTGLKSNLTSGNLDFIIRTILESAPICDDQDLIAIANIVLGVIPDELPICNPPAEVRPLIEDELAVSLRELAQTIPEQTVIDLDGLTNESTDSTSGRLPIANLRTARLLFLFSPILPLVLLIVLALFSPGSWTSFSRWVGIPLLAAGSLVLILDIFSLPLLHWLLNRIIPRMQSIVSSGMEQLAFGVVQNVAGRYAFWTGAAAILLLLAGCVLLFLPLLVRLLKR